MVSLGKALRVKALQCAGPRMLASSASEHCPCLLLGLATQITAVVRENRAGSLGTSIRRLAPRALHALAGWALWSDNMAALLATTTLATALLVHAIAAPLIFAALAISFFRGQQRQRRSPNIVQSTFAAARPSHDGGEAKKNDTGPVPDGYAPCSQWTS